MPPRRVSGRYRRPLTDRACSLKQQQSQEKTAMTDSAASGQQPALIVVGEGEAARSIAVRAREGAAPGLFWLGGVKAHMAGTKALALDAWAAGQQRGYIRFDYSGHGESGGAFADGTIGRWLEESVAVFERFCAGPQIVI